MHSIHASLMAMLVSFIIFYLIIYFTKPSWVMHTTKKGVVVLRQDKVLLWSTLGALFTALAVSIFYPEDKKYAMKKKWGMASCGAKGYRMTDADNATLM